MNLEKKLMNIKKEQYLSKMNIKVKLVFKN